jgi:DNA repair protein RecN (Recombination protein N)
MLSRIEIHDFALIEKATLTPGPGLLILTGETGAGKSILIDAISALGGERVSRDMIRYGQPKASIEAVFEDAVAFLPAELSEQLGLEKGDEELILSREINVSGKSICRVNGRLVSLALLQELAGWLIDIHGQHDQQSIFKTALHLQLLDRFGGRAVAGPLAAYQSIYQQYQACLRELDDLGRDPAQRARLRDMLQYQVREIEDAGIKPLEDELLTERRRVAANAGKIIEALAEAGELLDGDSEDSILARLGQVVKDLEQAGRHLNQMAVTSGQVREVLYLLQGAAGDIIKAVDAVEADPGELEQIDERLDKLFRIKQKYGGTLTAVLEFGREARLRLEQMEHGDARYEHLLRERDQLQAQLIEQGSQLSEARRQAAAGLERQITGELGSLNMKGVLFVVQFQPAGGSGSFERTGMDKVEFLLSANAGEPPRPLVRIASGGEASRIMLAIKSILASADRVPVLIFDEIDSGVSGRTAGRVAEKLQQLSRGRQVFCITHLAQIAAMADQHLLIEKTVNDGMTRTQLHLLDEESRKSELARLLSGGVGHAAAQDLAATLIAESMRFRQADVPLGTAPEANA